MKLLLALLVSLQLSALQLKSLAIEYDGGELRLLNQVKLPLEEEWLVMETPEEMVEAIVSLKTRGAPMIGLSAILSLAQMAERGASMEEIREAAYLLRKSRPTAVNLMIYIDRVLETKSKEELLATVEKIFLEDTALCEAMAEAGAALIQDGERILTCCNTGSLATAGIGTAIGVIKKAHAQGKKIHVYACETRPLLQGGRLTAWELEQCGIPFTLICDNMAASLMKKGMVDRVLVGADRIAVNGDFANKIGTYSLAVLARHHGIPFHPVAPYTTIDFKCESGDFIKIEERAANEVRGFGKLCWSPKDAPVYNPAFDVTPNELVTSYIFDCGNMSAEEIAKINP